MKTVQLHLLFKAFADPSRLRILHLLTRGERCVCDIMAVLKMGQSKVSRHLSYLRRAGLVNARKEGLWVHYSLVQPSNAIQGALFSCLGSCFSDAPMFRKDMETLDAIIKDKQAVRV